MSYCVHVRIDCHNSVCVCVCVCVCVIVCYAHMHVHVYLSVHVRCVCVCVVCVCECMHTSAFLQYITNFVRYIYTVGTGPFAKL